MKTGGKYLITQYCFFWEYCPARENPGFPTSVFPGGQYLPTLHCCLGRKHTCAFQVSRSYQGFCPDPKHFIVNCERNIDKYAEKNGGGGGGGLKQNDNADRPYLGFFRGDTWNTHIDVLFGLSNWTSVIRIFTESISRVRLGRISQENKV